MGYEAHGKWSGEVRGMEKIDAVVTGHPLGNLGSGSYDHWLIECSECGAVGVAPETEADSYAFAHLTQNHGAEAVSM
jgi:hypothetical protein